MKKPASEIDDAGDCASCRDLWWERWFRDRGIQINMRDARRRAMKGVSRK